MPFIDSTGLHNLESLCEKSKDDGIQVILSGVRPSVHDTIQKSKIFEMIGEENICSNIDIALSRANALLNAQPKNSKSTE